MTEFGSRPAAVAGSADPLGDNQALATPQSWCHCGTRHCANYLSSASCRFGATGKPAGTIR
eukprot:2482276-Pyramimonas_sp.AAC.1